MTRQEKKRIIKKHVLDMLNNSHEAMVSKVDIALNSGAVDVEKWEIDNAPMVIPKCIVTAILQREAVQYEGKGTSHEKYVKKTVRAIQYYI